MRQIATQSGVTGVTGNPETIGGHAAWVGEIRASSQQGESVIACAIVQRSASTSLELLGAAATLGSTFGETARGIRDIEAAKRSVTPKIIAVARPKTAAPLTTFLATLSGLAVPVDEIALINNLQSDERVTTSMQVKIVTK